MLQRKHILQWEDRSLNPVYGKTRCLLLLLLLLLLLEEEEETHTHTNTHTQTHTQTHTHTHIYAICWETAECKRVKCGGTLLTTEV